MLVLLLVLFVSSACASPLKWKDPRSRLDKNLLLDDILFPDGFDIKSGIVGDHYRWPNKELIYHIDPAFTPSEVAVIHQSISDITAATCITFRERTNERDYVFVRRGGENSGCNSYVGKIGGAQVLNLQGPFPGAGHCIWPGTVTHEFIHALGFYHEHSRTDRDDWITINWDNILPEFHFAFDKYPASMIDPFGVEYDYSSIMHYEDDAFAIDFSIPTIFPHDPDAQLGGEIMRPSDIQKLRNMYNCENNK